MNRLSFNVVYFHHLGKCCVKGSNCMLTIQWSALVCLICIFLHKEHVKLMNRNKVYNVPEKTIYTNGQKKRCIEVLKYFKMFWWILTLLFIPWFPPKDTLFWTELLWKRHFYRKMHVLSHDLHVQQLKRHPYGNSNDFLCIFTRDRCKSWELF